MAVYYFVEYLGNTEFQNVYLEILADMYYDSMESAFHRYKRDVKIIAIFLVSKVKIFTNFMHGYILFKVNTVHRYYREMETWD